MAAIASTATAYAQTDDRPQVQAVRQAGGAILTLTAGDLRVTQTLGANRLDLHIAGNGDAVRIAGDVEGQVVVVRGDERHAFSMKRATEADQRIVRALLTGSAALEAFQRTMQSRWARASKEAGLFTSAHALVDVLRGNSHVVSHMAAAQAAPAASVMPVGQKMTPDMCWNIYAHDVLKFTYDLEACMAEASNSLNPLRTAWCSYEYNIKASLSVIWLLDCYGW